MPKSGGDSFSRVVLQRILQILSEESKLKKTHLAGRARINYGMCIKYLNFLQELDWIEITQDADRGELVYITAEGMENLRKLKNEEIDGIVTRRPHFLDIDAESPRVRLFSKNASVPHAKDGRRKKIVIVDDHEDILTTYKLFLDNAGFQVRTFSDPRKAFEFLMLHPKSYDVIVLDIRMPEMSGVRLYQGIKAANSNARVIFLSSLDASPELMEIFPEIGKHQLLRKPVSRNELIQAILAIAS
jgi:CheY-like chemotaxis protein/predicted transcriptional regulator